MDIFKLFFEHDLRLDALRERHLDRETPETSLSIEAFMQPDPTYSKFYLSGSRMDNEQFGLSAIKRFQEVLSAIDAVLAGYHIHTARSSVFSLRQALDSTAIGDAIILTTSDTVSADINALTIDSDSNVGHRKEPLREALVNDELVLYKEQAHDGFDLHLFSKRNIYNELFYPLKELISDEFRFFSINGKRIRSERQFYFETWTLDRPPHGAEEVFPGTEI